MTHVVIVGAGIYGAGTALALRDAGVDVTVVEARTPGHAWAGSGGLSRVLRYEYGRDLLYVRLAALARDAWRALEARLGVTLYHETGILTLAASASSWERESFDALVAAGYHPEPLSAAEVTRRWPVISADGIGFAAYHAIGGFIAARRATEAIAATAESAGARFVRGAAVAGVVVEHGRAQGVQLASGERIAADAVVLAPGAWAASLLAAVGVAAPRSTRQVVTYVNTPAHGYGLGELPVFAELSAGFYGVPAWMPHGFKLANHTPGPVMAPGDAAQRTVRDEDLLLYRAYLANRFPGLKQAELVEPHVCCYAMTADEHFLLGRAPDVENVVIATGFSGHGFKFAAALWPEIAALVQGKAPQLELELERFRVDRRG